MTAERPDDWEDLRRHWQSESVPREVAASARRRVERGRRKLLLTVAVEAVAVLVVAAWSVHLLSTRPEPVLILVLLVFWTFGGVLAGFGILKRRGTWSPSSESTHAYLKLSLERALREIEIAEFTLRVMGFWLLFTLGMIAWSVIGVARRGEDVLPSLAVAGIVLFATFGMLGFWTVLMRRRARVEAADLEGTLREFEQHDESDPKDGGVHDR